MPFWRRYSSVLVNVRPGIIADCRQMTALLNDIIAADNTTALTKPLTQKALPNWMAADQDRSAWHVAETAAGDIVGFQWIGPSEHLTSGAIDIGTFIQIDQSIHVITSKLFEATKQIAFGMGYDWIHATIRADNESGLTYYQSQGFRIWGKIDNVALADGSAVDKVLMRFDLKN